MRVVLRGAGAACAIAVALCGCRTTEEVLRDYNADFKRGIYERGAKETGELADDGDSDELLWRQLAASAFRLAGNLDESQRHFAAADRLYAVNDTRNAFSRGATTASAMMVNDSVFDYDGDGIDRVWTCLYQGIDALAANNPDAARVFFNRVGQRQENWLRDRQKEIDAAARRFEADKNQYLRSQGAGGARMRTGQVGAALSNSQLRDQFIAHCGFDPAGSNGDLKHLKSTREFMNPYAMHVFGVCRWILRDSDRNELKSAASYLPRSQMAKRDAAERAKGIRPKDQVWVYIEDGLCPERKEWRLDLPLAFVPGAGDYSPYVAMAFPTLEYRDAASERWRVEGVEPDLVCDVDRLVKTEYDIYMKGAVVREITRTLVRAGMEIALGILAEECARDCERGKDRRGEFWAYKLSQLAVAGWAATCTKADTRSWTALPKRVFATRVTRPKSGRIAIVAIGETLTVDLPPGNSMVFVRKPGPFAPSDVKTFTAR